MQQWINDVQLAVKEKIARDKGQEENSNSITNYFTRTEKMTNILP